MSFTQSDIDDLKMVHDLILRASGLIRDFRLRHGNPEEGDPRDGAADPESDESLARHEAFVIVREIDDIVETALTPAASAHASVSKIVESFTTVTVVTPTDRESADAS